MGQLFWVMPNLRPKNVQNFFIYRALWTLNVHRGSLGTNFFGHAKIEVKNFSEFFHLQSAVDAEFFTGGGQAPTFLGHAKFEVKKLSEFFNLQSTLNAEFFRESSRHQHFFGHSKFEVKSFFGIFSFTEYSGI